MLINLKKEEEGNSDQERNKKRNFNYKTENDSEEHDVFLRPILS